MQVLSNLFLVVALSLLTSDPEFLVAVCSIFLISYFAKIYGIPDFPHLGNGSRAALIHHGCLAHQTIYVPEDPTIRKACIVQAHDEPHSHPILPPTKTPIAIKEIYRQCVENAGIVGSSVRTVDNGKSYLLGKFLNLISFFLKHKL